MSVPATNACRPRRAAAPRAPCRRHDRSQIARSAVVHRPGHRVARLRPVERDGGDAAVDAQAVALSSLMRERSFRRAARSRSSASMPSSSRISSLCSPSSGGWRRTCCGVPGQLHREADVRHACPRPDGRSPSACRAPRRARCRTPPGSCRIGPAGMPTASSVLDPLSFGCVRKVFSSSSISAARFASRSATVGKARVVRTAPAARAAAHSCAPQLVAVRAHHEIAVRRGHRLVRRASSVGGAERLAARLPVPQYSEMSQTENAIAASNSDPSTYWPWPVFCAPDVGAHRIAYTANSAQPMSATGTPAFHRRAAGIAGDAHHARHRLRHQVEAGPLGPRPGLAEAGDAGVDQPRIDRLQRLVVDAEPLRHAGPVVLDQDVRVSTSRSTPRAPACASG